MIEIGKSHYTHEIEVRFVEGLLSSSNDWQWFIEYTEETFEPPLKLESMSDYPACYSSVQPAYVHLARIVDQVGDVKLKFNTAWLNRVYECVLVRSGLMQPEDCIKENGFFDILCIASFGTYLINCVSKSSYLYNAQLLVYSNLHQLYDFEPLGDDRSRIVSLSKRIDVPGFSNVIDTLSANFNSTLILVDKTYVSNMLDEHFDADFLSFKNVKKRSFQTWQEALLCDAFEISFINGNIEPVVRYGNGTEVPDTTAWSEIILSLAKEAFSDARAVCVIEALEFGKHDIAPSAESQEILVKLCIEHAESCASADRPVWNLSCTSFNILEQLISEKKLDRDIKSRFNKRLSELLSEKSDYQEICYMREHSLPCSKKQHKIFTDKTTSLTKDSLASVQSVFDLISVLKNSTCARNCDSDDMDTILNLFSKYSKNIDINTSELFYWAMMFFIDMQDNPRIVNKLVRRVLINLRNSWQDQYYATVVSNMHVFTHESTISKSEVDNINEAFLDTPNAIASLILPSDTAIADTLESMSEYVITLVFSKTTISEYYPDHIHVTYPQNGHSIDAMIASEIQRVYDNNGHRFLNAMSYQNMVDGYYEQISQKIDFTSSLIDIKPAYKWILENTPRQYNLMPFPENQPRLGDLTQLFPLLENTIRKLGEIFDIVPFQAKKESFTRLKDAPSVLSDLIGEVRELTGTIQGCNEFLFVYYVMYSENGFNIRNDCIHGRQYQDNNGVARGFKLTVICTYMMMKRLVDIEATSNGDVLSNSINPGNQP